MKRLTIRKPNILMLLEHRTKRGKMVSTFNLSAHGVVF
jgi:hypothetical protein